LQHEPGLACTARPGQREKPGILTYEKIHDLAKLSLASEERHRRYGQVGPVEALERGKLAGAELKNALRSAEILEAMLAEVGQLGIE
jgi:hypothetical protein